MHTELIPLSQQYVTRQCHFSLLVSMICTAGPETPILTRFSGWIELPLGWILLSLKVVYRKRKYSEQKTVTAQALAAPRQSLIG